MDPFLNPTAVFTRLWNEYQKHGTLVIGFDFDDTVHDYHQRGSTFPQLIKLLRDMHKLGFKLVCWTAHPNHDYVNNYLYEHKIPFDGINTDGIDLDWETRKPFFSALLDDRAGLREVHDVLRELVDLINKKEQK
jgi:phosphoglycolate phosphatase-like HAD superfamily hydrolase